MKDGLYEEEALEYTWEERQLALNCFLHNNKECLEQLVFPEEEEEEVKQHTSFAKKIGLANNLFWYADFGSSHNVILI